MKQFNKFLFGVLLTVLAFSARGQTIDQSFDSETIPYGWVNDASNNADWIFTDKNSYGPSADHSGSGYYAFFNSRNISQNQQGKLITPRLDLTSGSTTLSYWVYLKKDTYGGFGGNILFVEASVDESEEWIVLMEHHRNTNVNQWVEYTIDLSDYNTSDNVRIRFRAVSTGHDWEMGYTSIALDDVTGPNLFALDHDVSIIDATNDYIYRKDVAGKFSVNIKNWGSNPENFSLDYELASNPEFNGSVSVTNLEPNETRAVEVPVLFESEMSDEIVFFANLVDDGNLDGNTIEVPFTVYPNHILITEEFTTLKGDKTPLGWSKAKGVPGEELTYGVSNWKENTTYNYSPPQSAYIGFSGYNSAPNSDWIISHPTSTQDEGALRVSYQAMVNNMDIHEDDFINIMYTVDDGDTWELIGTIEGDDFTKDQWNRYYFNVPEIESTSVKFGLYAFDGLSGLTRNIYIDDFLVERAPQYDFAMLPPSLAPEAMQDMVMFSGEELTIDAVVANYGTETDNIPVKWLLQETNDSGSEEVTVNPGEQFAFSFADKLITPEDNGYYTLKIFTDHMDDFDRTNDTVYVQLGVYSPYTEFEENFDESKNLPLGWSALVPAADANAITVQTSYARSTPNSIRMYSFGTPHNALLITPAINFEEGKDFRFRFWMNGNASAAVQVGILTDPADSTTFELVDSFELAQAWTFQQNEATLTHHEQAHIAIRYATKGANVYLDDVSLEAILPYGVEVEAITANRTIAQGGSVVFTGKVSNSGGLDETFNLTTTSELDAVITDENGDPISTVTLNVDEEALVYIHVTAPQEIEDAIEESITLIATSENNPAVLDQTEFSLYSYKPYASIEEGFESGTTFPQGWVPIQTLENLIRIYASSFNANTGDNYVHFGNGPADETAMIVLPAVQEYPLYRISLYAKGNGSFEIGTVEDPYEADTFESIQVIANPGYSYQQFSLDVEAADGIKYIAIKMMQDGSYNSIQIDDILVEPVSEFDFDAQFAQESQTTYAGGSVWYDAMISNSGYGNDTYGLSVESEWTATIYHEEDDVEITSITVSSGEQGNFRIKVEVPVDGVTNGQEEEVDVLITSQGNELEKTISSLAIGYNPFDELTENFDAVSTMPQFWTVIKGGASTVNINTNASHAHSPNNSLSLYKSSYSEEHPIAVLPAMEQDNQYELSYWVKGDLGATILVGTMDNPNDESTFNEISSFDVFAVYSQQKIHINASEMPVIIAFKNESLGKTIYIDDVSIFTYSTMEITPADGSENIPADQEITLTFSRSVTLMDGVEITNSNVSDFVTIEDITANEELNFSAVVNEEKTEIVITANELFASEHEIKVTVDNVQDINGVTVQGVTTQFTIVDINPPLWAEGYPAMDQIGGTHAKVNVMLNEPATFYYMLIKANEEAPSVDDIFQGEAYGDVTPVIAGNQQFTDDVVTLSLTDLEQVTSYSLYMAAIDMAGNEQTQAVTLNFTTLDITPPVWDEGYPVMKNVGEDFATFAVALNKASTVSYIVILAGETVPSVQQIIDGTDYDNVTLAASGSLEFTDEPVEETVQELIHNTDYELYLVATDNEGTTQENSVMVEFKTEKGTSVEVDLMNSVGIYPNPFSESIQVDTEYNVQNIRIYNQNGSLVKYISGNDVHKPIKLSSLSSGSYIAVIELTDGRRVSKVLIKN